MSIIDQNSGDAINLWVGTQSEYDAITSKDENTLYFIKESNRIIVDPPGPEPEPEPQPEPEPEPQPEPEPEPQPEPEPEPAPFVTWSDITNVPTSVTLTGPPRAFESYNPESDTNGYGESWRYWHQGTRRIRLFVRYENNGDFQVITNHNRSGDQNVDGGYLQPYTVLFSGKWLDRPVAAGESFRTGSRIIEVDGQPVSSVMRYRNVGNGADLDSFNSYVETTSTSNWAGHGVNILEHSLAPDNGQPYYVDTLHLDPNVDITGSFKMELWLLGSASYPGQVNEISFDVNYTLQGEPATDAAQSDPIVLMSATDGFVFDVEEALRNTSLYISKPAEAANQTLFVSAGTQVDFHMMFQSDIGSTIDLSFGSGWTVSGQTITLNRGDYYTGEVTSSAAAGDILDVTATSVLLGETFTKTIPIRIQS